MATWADVRRIARSLPDTEEAANGFTFSVQVKGKPKGFAWIWRERVDPRKPRVPNRAAVVVRVASLIDKDLLLRDNPGRYFTEPHFDGYPAILVRLAEVKVAELRALLVEAKRCLAAPVK